MAAYLISTLIVVLAVGYGIIGGAMAVDEPEPILWIFLWPIMLWKELRKGK